MDLIQAFKKKHSDSVADDNQRQETIDSIRKGEKKLHVSHKALDDMTRDELKGYLAELRYRWKEKRDEATPEAEANTGNITSQEDTATAIPDEIRGILSSVADHYDVEAEAIYDEYIELRDLLDMPYPLNRFKKVLRDASNGCIVFEAGFIRPLKLNYKSKLTYDKITVYRLTEDNSKDDMIKEAHKAEAVCYELGDKHILTKRAKSTGETRLDKVMSKEKLLEYLWKLFDTISERLAKVTKTDSEVKYESK